MPVPALLLLGAAVAAYLVAAPLRRALVGLLAVEVLLPAVLVVPNPGSSYPTFGRVALAAVVVNVVRRWWRGDLADDAWRWTPAHVALAGLVVVGLVNGVLLAEAQLSTWTTLHGWMTLVDQLVLFVVATAVLRTDPDPRWLLRGMAAVVVASAGIAAVEHVTGGAWGHWLFAHRSTGRGLDAAQALDVRDGRHRVRAGAEFALEFGWVTTMLLPALIASVVLLPRRHRWLVLAMPALAVAAVYWSYSRSPLPFVAVAAVTTWVGSSFSKRIGAIVALLLLGGIVLLAVSPGLLTPLTSKANEATVDVRRERLPRVAEVVAGRSVQGLGIGGLDRIGIPTTDASYQRAYGQFGVTGAAWLLVTVAVAVGTSARSLRSRTRVARLAGAAMTTGVVVAAFGAASFDLFSVGGASSVFWILAAGGTVLGERAAGPSTPWHESAARAGIVVGAVAAGTAIALVWPRQVVATERYELLAPARETLDVRPPIYGDDVLRRSVCGAIELYGRSAPGIGTSCRETSPLTGITEVRISADDVAGFQAARDAVDGIARRYGGGRVASTSSPPRRVRPTLARTGPVWSGLFGLGLAFFAPPLRSRRRRSAATGTGGRVAVG